MRPGQHGLKASPKSPLAFFCRAWSCKLMGSTKPARRGSRALRTQLCSFGVWLPSPLTVFHLKSRLRSSVCTTSRIWLAARKHQAPVTAVTRGPGRRFHLSRPPVQKIQRASDADTRLTPRSENAASVLDGTSGSAPGGNCENRKRKAFP